ncbi:hypothetical protein ACKS0A_06311 [Histoplasma ohiense]
MLIPAHRAPRDLYALPNRIINTFIHNNDITTLRERRDNTRYRGERLRINNTGRHAEGGCNVCLSTYVHVLSPVETRWPAGADAVCAESLDGFLLEVLIRDKVVEVGGGEVDHGAAVGEF